MTSSTARVIVAGMHQSPALAADHDVTGVAELCGVSVPSPTDYLLWLGSSPRHWSAADGGKTPYVDFKAYGNNARQIVKGNAKEMIAELRASYSQATQIELLFCAPLRYLHGKWWVSGRDGHDIHHFELPWLANELIPMDRAARLRFHSFRGRKGPRWALPLDHPDSAALKQINEQLRRNGKEWTCVSDDGLVEVDYIISPAAPNDSSDASRPAVSVASSSPTQSFLLCGTTQLVNHLKTAVALRSFAVALEDKASWLKQLQSTSALLCGIDPNELQQVPSQLDLLIETCAKRKITIYGVLVNWKDEARHTKARVALDDNFRRVISVPSVEELTGPVLQLVTPRVFISYAHEDEQYKKRIAQLVVRLAEDGFNVRFDQLHVDGRSFADFMHAEAEQADKVLVLCSPAYRRKVRAKDANLSISGVANESSIIRAGLSRELEYRKQLVTVLARGDEQHSVPSYLIGLDRIRLILDDQLDEDAYSQLVRKLSDELEPKPRPGPTPYQIALRVEPLRGRRD